MNNENDSDIKEVADLLQNLESQDMVIVKVSVLRNLVKNYEDDFKNDVTVTSLENVSNLIILTKNLRVKYSLLLFSLVLKQEMNPANYGTSKIYSFSF